MTTAEGTEPDRVTGAGTAPALLLGPMLRYVSETAATIWVETDRPCQVEILGREAATFEVAGHHYGLVVLEDLQPGAEYPYQVALDGARRWPVELGGFPPSVLRTLSNKRPQRIAFGSCRVTQIPAATRAALERAADRTRRRGKQLAPNTDGNQWTDADALAACAGVLRETPPERWPDALLMIGDQVYADNPGPAAKRFIAEHRAQAAASPPAARPLSARPLSARAAESAESAESASEPAPAPVGAAPADEAADFEEYRALYQEAWSVPAVRWLFSVVPTAMIFDDHDFHDDWNTSATWRRDFHASPWARSRIEGAYVSYWIYQHLGNLSPDELGQDDTWRQVRQAPDAAKVLIDLAHRSDARDPGVRWSFTRTFGKVRVVMIDSRSRRVTEPGRRRMTDEAQWQWVTGSVAGDWDHVVLATSVPPLLPRGIHALESWNAAVTEGAWGARLAAASERFRQRFDLEHWPAFPKSFSQLEDLLTGLAAGTYGSPPASVTIISGDIHHSFLAAVDLPRPAGGAPGTVVSEAVCSPFHQAMPPKMIRLQRLASTRLGGAIGTAVARLAGARKPRIGWRITAGPWFDNMIATLQYDQRTARITFDRAVTDPGDHAGPGRPAGPGLATTLETTLAG